MLALLLATDAVLRWDALAPLPNALGVAGPFAGVSADCLLVAGGANFPHGYPWDGGKKATHAEVYLLPSPSATWQTAAAKLPIPTAYGVSLTLAHRRSVLCLGGNDATGAALDAVYELVANSDHQIVIRRELPNLPTPSTMACGAVLGETVLYFSGESGGSTRRSFYQLDLKTQPHRWQTLPWPETAPGRILAVAGVLGGKFYVFSGCDLGADTWDKRTYLTDAWSFDPKTRLWQKLANQPHATAAAPNVAIPSPAGDCLRIFGGSNRDFVETQRQARPATNGNGPAHPGFPNQILAYVPTTNTWRTEGMLPQPAPVTTTSVPWQGSWIIPSGESKPGIRTPQILRVR
jgi:N-acetylneuraminic acid mutarotase